MLLEEVFRDMGILTIDPLELTKKLYKENVEDTGIFDEPRYVKALKSVHSWYSSEYTFFRGSEYEILANTQEKEIPYKPSKNYGWLLYNNKENYEYVGFVPKILKDKLKEEGFQDPDQIIKDWAEKEIIPKYEYKQKNGKIKIDYSINSYISSEVGSNRLIRIPVENFNKYTSNKYLDEGIAEEDESEEEENEFEPPEKLDDEELKQNRIETMCGVAQEEKEEADERAKCKIEPLTKGRGHVRILNNLN